MTYRHLTYEQCAARWPRLVKAMQWAAILSSSEAATAIRDYRDAREALNDRSPFDTNPHRNDWRAWGADIMNFGGCEAVAHFGGPKRALLRGIACRHFVKR